MGYTVGNSCTITEPVHFVTNEVMLQLFSPVCQAFLEAPWQAEVHCVRLPLSVFAKDYIWEVRGQTITKEFVNLYLKPPSEAFNTKSNFK